MIHRIFKFTLLILTVASSSIVFAENTKPTNVILLTLDGVRWNEVFEGTDSRLTHETSAPIMSHLLGELSNEGVLLGDQRESEVEVSNLVNLSLPGYQNIFAGHPQFCFTNDCNTVRVETFPEKLAKSLALDKMNVAGFASWGKLARAFAHETGSTFFSAGQTNVELNDFVHQDINAEQMKNPPPWNHSPGLGSRYDRFTFAHGLHYLETHHPRFLYISLLDADEHGHRNDYPSYVQTIHQYDLWIKTLTDTLKKSGEYGQNTLLIVTTDHGRGETPKTWHTHGPQVPYSHQIWMYLWGKGIDPKAPLAKTHFSHNDIRPMIEKAMGVRR